MAVREAEPVASLSEVKEAGLDREDLLGIYRNLLITRGIGRASCRERVWIPV